MIACVDLFCGLGGLTHGLIKGGIRVIAGVDVDPQCCFPLTKQTMMPSLSSRTCEICLATKPSYLWKGDSFLAF